MTPSGQWDLLELPVLENLIIYGCCPEPFSDITFHLQLRRKALFYVFNLLFPSIFMSLMSLLSFYLPAESGEKLGLNITVLLSLVFFLLLGAQLLPPTSDSVSLLGRYHISWYCEMISLLSVLICCVCTCQKWKRVHIIQTDVNCLTVCRKWNMCCNEFIKIGQ